jgi:hypothetical protein
LAIWQRKGLNVDAGYELLQVSVASRYLRHNLPTPQESKARVREAVVSNLKTPIQQLANLQSFQPLLVKWDSVQI